jgi:predicted polyphosphate/ATP-dependent NAD kinase
VSDGVADVDDAAARPGLDARPRARIGLVVNPVAGIGGPAALRGSDGADIQARARAAGVLPRAAARVAEALRVLPTPGDADWFAWGGAMGADILASLGIPCEVVGVPAGASTSPADTRAAVRALHARRVDLLLFAGGDGTARDVLSALAETGAAAMPCLGIPAGVKMHSSVFALTPHAAGAVLARLVAGELLAVRDGEVRDIDEAALRAGRIDNRWFGTLRVPALAGYMQNLKVGGRESEPLAQEEAAAGVVAKVQAAVHAEEGEGVRYVLGAGSTLLAVKRQLGFDGTLLGVDVWQDGALRARDIDEAGLLALAADGTPTVVVLSPTGNQGSLLGRGNQQLSARFLRAAAATLCVVATRGKLEALQGRPLWVDTGDADLDAHLCGLVEVVCGYDATLLYRVATA